MHKRWLIVLFTLMNSMSYCWLRPEAGCFGLEAEILWLQPALDDTYVAIVGPVQQTPQHIQGERIYGDFGFHTGYRFEGVYTFCNCVTDARLRYTHFSASSNKEVSGANNIAPTQTPPSLSEFEQQDSAATHSHVNFHSWDLLLGHLIYDCAPLDLELELGVQYTFLRVKESYIIIANIVRQVLTNYKNTLKGIGPEIAFDARYQIPFCFPCLNRGRLSLVSNGKVALLVSSNESSIRSNNVINSTTTTFINTNNQKSWRVTPALELQIGLNYIFPFRCWDFSIEGGYQVIDYLRSVQKTRYVTPPNVDSTSFDEYGDFTLHGPYLAIGVTF